MVRALSFSDTISLPHIGPVHVPSPAQAARGGLNAAKRFARSPAGRRAAQFARMGSRIAGRYIPLIIAIELAGDGFLADVPDLTAPFGKLALDLRGPWTLGADCGIPAQMLKWDAAAPACGVDFVIAPGTGKAPAPGAISKGFQLWGDVYPLRYYINGRDIKAKGAQAYTGTPFPDPPLSSRFNAALTFPVADLTADDRPKMVALAAAAVPQGRPSGTPLPIPIGAWPHIGPNANVPSTTQIQTGGYKRDVAQPTKPVVAKPAELPTWVESLPIPMQQGLSKPLPASANPVITLASQGQSTTADPHKFQPPGRGEKENKFVMKPNAKNLVLRTFNGVSEYRDLVDALYWAIDTDSGYTGNIRYGKKIYDWRRPPGRKVWWKDSAGKWQSRWVNDVSLQEKSDFIYRHWADLDLAKAAANVLKNELGDYAYGRLGAQYGKAARAAYNAGVAQPSRSPTLSRASGNNPTGKLPLKPLYDAIDKAFGVNTPSRNKWTAREIAKHPQSYTPALGVQYYQ